MGAVICSIKSFLDTIIDIVGIKSGLVLSRHEVIEILKTRTEDFDLEEDDLNQGMRIRSETYEDHIRYVRVRIGNLSPEMMNPFLWSDTLIKWHKKGIDPMPVVKALATVSAKHPQQKVDPELVISEMQGLVPTAPLDLIFSVIRLWIDHQHQSHYITQPQIEEWDGGTPLTNLFSCEIRTGNNFMDQKFLDYIAANIEKIQEMHWRNFERFCAEFFNRLGYHIKLGPGGNDGGIDIRAFDPADNTKPLIIIQCKRYKNGLQVGIETVKAFYTDVEFEQAKQGIIITTSAIAPGGKKVCEARKYPLTFAEIDEVQRWAKAMSSNT